MRSCYLFVMVDKYGCEMKAEPDLEAVQDYALAYIGEQYMVEISTVDELRKWEAAQTEMSIKFYHLNIATLDCLEDL